MPPEGVWTTCRHMQSPRELQQLNNWSVNAEIRITARQSSVENKAAGGAISRTPAEQEFANQGANVANHRPSRCGATIAEVPILLDFYGERGGTRTLDPMIKSHVLYHLSYALTCLAV